jgi:hypothetical protein
VGKAGATTFDAKDVVALAEEYEDAVDLASLCGGKAAVAAHVLHPHCLALAVIIVQFGNVRAALQPLEDGQLLFKPAHVHVRVPVICLGHNAALEQVHCLRTLAQN